MRVLCSAAPAAMLVPHPLGNFPINQYYALHLRPDQLVDESTAGLPALQEPPDATRACGQPLRWKPETAALISHLSEAQLQTARLACGPVQVEFTNGVRAEYLGWRGIMTVGDGTWLNASSAPATRVPSGLRDCPCGLLPAPSNVHTARVTAEPGTSPSASSPAAWLLAAWNGRATDRESKPVSLLALLLGGMHTPQPGHGKRGTTRYLTGRQGRPRDAVTVGWTVTFTHTAGSLATGCAMSVLAALGIEGNLLVTAIRALPRPHHQHWHAHSNTKPIGQETTGGLDAQPAHVDGSAGRGRLRTHGVCPRDTAPLRPEHGRRPHRRRAAGAAPAQTRPPATSPQADRTALLQPRR